MWRLSAAKSFENFWTDAGELDVWVGHRALVGTGGLRHI
jgi:hypothetical protein